MHYFLQTFLKCRPVLLYRIQVRRIWRKKYNPVSKGFCYAFQTLLPMERRIVRYQYFASFQ